MATYEFFTEMAEVVALGERHRRALRAASALVEPHLAAVVDEFYDTLRRNETMRSVFESDAQIERQKAHLLDWARGLFGGEYGEAYFEKRAEIGRVHVRIGLPQRYMVSMMNVLRMRLGERMERVCAQLGEEACKDACEGLQKLLDVDLAVMLETYREAMDVRLRGTERLAALGQLAASIGHELRNPLAVIDTSLHLARSRSEDERLQKHLGKIGKQVRISNQIIADLLDLARDRAAVREPTHLETLMKEALEVVDAKGVPVRLEIEDAEAKLDGSQIRQLVVNLVQNASQAIRSDGGSGTITLRAEREGDEVHIEVLDDGPGLSPDVLAHLFEPLFTTRATGIGLGLALCKRIAEKHGGSIEASNRDGGGARFLVRLAHEP